MGVSLLTFRRQSGRGGRECCPDGVYQRGQRPFGVAAEVKQGFDAQDESFPRIALCARPVTVVTDDPLTYCRIIAILSWASVWASGSCWKSGLRSKSTLISRPVNTASGVYSSVTGDPLSQPTSNVSSRALSLSCCAATYFWMHYRADNLAFDAVRAGPAVFRSPLEMQICRR